MLPHAKIIEIFYNWLLDSKFIPYIVVNVTCEGVDVPTKYVVDGKIVLDINPNAIIELNINESEISFCANFDEIKYLVKIPIVAVISVFAKDNGIGIVFQNSCEAKDMIKNKKYTPPKLRILNDEDK